MSNKETADFISFVITYPYAYFRNNLGELVLDKNVKNFQVEHEGTVISNNEWEGEWSATVESVKTSSLGDYQELYITGNWNLKRTE